MTHRFCFAKFVLALSFLGCTPAPEVPEPAPEPNTQAEAVEPKAPEVLTIDVMSHLPERTLDMPEPQLVVLSDYAQPNAKKVIRVTTNLRTTRNGRIAGEDLEERIFNLLTAKTPEPFELQRAKTLEKGDQTWGILNLTFKRTSERLRRASKTAPWRSRANFGLSIDVKLPENQVSSWTKFNFNFVDEHYADEDLKVNQAFWRALEAELPTFTASSNASDWARAIGLVTSRLSNEAPDKLELPKHQTYDKGCVVYQENDQTFVRQLQSPFAHPRPLSISTPLELRCDDEATFVFALNGQNDVDLYYQPSMKNVAWKTGIHFETQVSADNFDYHLDDDLICVWNGKRASSARRTEIHCLDRKTGMPRWQTTPFNGMVRGFAATNESLTFVTDQAAFAISRPGSLVYVHKLAPVKARLPEARSCHNDNTLVFSMNPGYLTFMDLANGDVTWQLNAFNSEKLFCAQDNVVVFSEAGGYLLGVNARELKPLWKYRPVSMPRDILSFGHSLILLMDRAIVALDAQTGVVQTSFKLPVRAQTLIRLGQRLYLDQENAIAPLRLP